MEAAAIKIAKFFKSQRNGNRFESVRSEPQLVRRPKPPGPYPHRRTFFPIDNNGFTSWLENTKRLGQHFRFLLALKQNIVKHHLVLTCITQLRRTEKLQVSASTGDIFKPRRLQFGSKCFERLCANVYCRDVPLGTDFVRAVYGKFSRPATKIGDVHP